MIYVLQSLNGAQFLNATCVAAANSISAVSAAFLLLTAISPATKIYASEYMHASQGLDSNEPVKIWLDHNANN